MVGRNAFQTNSPSERRCRKRFKKLNKARKTFVAEKRRESTKEGETTFDVAATNPRREQAIKKGYRFEKEESFLLLASRTDLIHQYLMSSPTVLVVEDDAAVRQGIVDALGFAGYQVLSAADGRAGREAALNARYDLLLLDLVLPHFTGFEILEALRRSRAGQAVIILSARGEENDRVQGLKMGADDYVVKSFSARELLARVDAVLRRTTERQALHEEYEVAGRVIDFSRSEVRFEGASNELSPRETGILRYLLANPERAVPRDELLRHVWGIDPKRVETRTVDMHIAHLRKKLGDHSQTLLETQRGRGYRLVRKP